MSYLKPKYSVESIMTVASSGVVSQFLTLIEVIKVKISPAIHLFKSKYCKCDVCGVEGDHFRIKPTGKDKFASLVSINKNGTKMTVDHHTPRCLGGITTLENTIPMCHKCNSEWKSKFDVLEKDKKEGIIQLTKEMMI